MNANLHRVIGIDLGTTYSAVSAYNTYTEQAEIIVDHSTADAATTPSVVSLDPVTRKAMVGRAAKQNLPADPANTIIEIKREMGEEFRPETLEKYNAQNIFNAGDPVKAFLNGQWLLPQQISGLILMKMKEIAEAEIGEEIRDAVITVPAYFTERQRKATKEAALLAGLYPRQLIPEPTAAAICYGVDRAEEERRVYMVYDLGGGTFDVSIIQVQGTDIEVIATSGDPRLGGGDFDDLLTQWAVTELQSKFQINFAENPGAKARIKNLAEQAKINLSTHASTQLNLAELAPAQAPLLTITQTEFEALIHPLLIKSITYIDVALDGASKKGVRREDINAILLVGGSSKIPKVKSMLLDHFGKNEDFVRSDLNPDEVVARGAAIIAYRFSASPAPFDITRQQESTLMNVDAVDQPNIQLITEHSLGVEVQNKIFSKIVDQGTGIPIEITQGGYTNGSMASEIPVRVYQGEGTYVYENTLIGVLNIGPMTPQPEGFHKFEVTFKLDMNGLLSMTINHVNEGRSYQAVFEHKTGVGGDAALIPMRQKLLQIYLSAAAQANAGQAAGYGPGAVPPPPPMPGAVPPPPGYAAPDVYTPATPPPPPAPQPSPVTAADAVELLEPEGDVPDEFKSIVRRAKKQLLVEMNADLARAYNAFAQAFNENKSIDELQDLSDELEDAYHDARK